MGIIQKQALRSTVVNYIGMGFGVITRFVMPLVLQQAQIGTLELLNSISGLFITGLNFGYNLILKKLFFTYKDDDNGHSGFLALGLILSILGTLIGVIIFYSFISHFNNGPDKNSLLKSFFFLIPILIFFRLLFFNLDGYIRMLFKTVIGTFLEGFVAKVILLLTMLFLVFGLIEFDTFVYFYCFALSFPGLFVLFYAFFITKKITLPSTELMGRSKVIKSYILFGILSASSYSIVQYVDTLMIKYLSLDNGEAEVGVYTTFFFASILLLIPLRSIGRIAGVILADSWQKNDLKNIQSVYEKSALNLLIIGGFLFIIGWSCIDSVLEFKAFQSYAYGKNVFLFLGIARLFELSTGVNQEIIETSDKYKYNTYFNIILALFAIVFNLILIPIYGILGAGFATFCSLVIINLMRGVFLYKTYKLIPFGSNYIKTLLVVLSFIGISSFLKFNVNPILQIILNVSLLTVLYWGFIIKFNLSEDINTWLHKIKNKIFNTKLN